MRNPVTGELVTWIPESSLSAHEKAVRDQLDIFPLSSARLVRKAGSFTVLKNKALRGTIGIFIFICASIAVTAVTVWQGWLVDERYAIVPTMGCICIGVGTTISAIAIPRLRTASRLVKAHAPGGEPFPTSLIDRYCDRFRPATGESTTAVKLSA